MKYYEIFLLVSPFQQQELLRLYRGQNGVNLSEDGPDDERDRHPLLRRSHNEDHVTAGWGAGDHVVFHDFPVTVIRDGFWNPPSDN